MVATFTQMNVHIEPEWVDQVERLANENSWSKAQTIRVAIRTLAEVMSKHTDAPRLAKPDMRELYERVSREIPGQLVEVSRSVEFLYFGEVPAILAEGWLLWEDAATGELLAREREGQQRFGWIRNGKVEAMISPAQAVKN